MVKSITMLFMILSIASLVFSAPVFLQKKENIRRSSHPSAALGCTAEGDIASGVKMFFGITGLGSATGSGAQIISMTYSAFDELDMDQTGWTTTVLKTKKQLSVGSSVTTTNPNGLAYDKYTGALVYASYGTTGGKYYLYWIDTKSPTANAILLGQLTYRPSSATFYRGEYIYGAQETKEIRKITFKVMRDSNGAMFNISMASDTNLYNFSKFRSYSDVSVDRKGKLYINCNILNANLGIQSLSVGFIDLNVEPLGFTSIYDVPIASAPSFLNGAIAFDNNGSSLFDFDGKTGKIYKLSDLSSTDFSKQASIGCSSSTAPFSLTSSATCNRGFVGEMLNISNGLRTLYSTTGLGGVSDVATFTCPPMCSLQITCPKKYTVSMTESCNGIVTWDAVATVTNGEDCLTSAVTSDILNNTLIIGTTRVNFYVSDYLSTATCFIDVIVTDTTKPKAICPLDITHNMDMGKCIYEATFIDTGMTDNCPISRKNTFDRAFTDIYSEGMTRVKNTAIDDNGNLDSCEFKVTVNPDHEMPSLMIDLNGKNQPCGSTLNYEVDTDKCSKTLSFAIAAADNCGIQKVEQTVEMMHHVAGEIIVPEPLTGKYMSIISLALGTTAISFKATDLKNNAFSCNYTVNIMDTMKPILSCPENPIIAMTNFNTCEATVDYKVLVSYTDNCNVTADFSKNFGTLFSGNTDVSINLVDQSNNMAKCEFSVDVQDKQKPTINKCYDDIKNIPLDQNSCKAVMTYDTILQQGGALFTDNCGLSTRSFKLQTARGFSVIDELNPDFSASMGSNNVTFMVTDSSNNIETCDFIITVDSDTQPPTIQADYCHPDVELNIVSGCTGDFIFDPAAIDENMINDNCESDDALIASATFSSTTFKSGIHAVTMTIKDSMNLMAQCTFLVMVSGDSEKPTIDFNPMTFFTDANMCSIDISLESLAKNMEFYDNCPPDNFHAAFYTETEGEKTFLPASFTVNKYSPLEIFVMVEDGNMNTATNSFLITPIDNQPPKPFGGDETAMNTFQATLEISLQEGSCMTKANLRDILPEIANHGATDNCDKEFNSYIDNTLIISYFPANGQAKMMMYKTFDKASPENFDYSLDGLAMIGTEMTIEYCVGDDTSLCKYDTSKKEFNCADKSLSCLAKKINFLGDVLKPIFPNCPTSSLKLDTTMQSEWENGVLSRVCSVDTTNLFHILRTVDDNGCAINPDNFKMEINGELIPNHYGSIFNFFEKPTIGNEAAITKNMPFMVKFSYTDMANNEAMPCVFNVEVFDAEKPMITCPTLNQYSLMLGTCGVEFNLPIPDTPSDNCYTTLDTVQVFRQFDGGDIIPLEVNSLGYYFKADRSMSDQFFGYPSGNHKIFYTATDLQGNQGTCETMLVINADQEAPTITCPEEFTAAADDSCSFSYSNINMMPMFKDNCDSKETLTESMTCMDAKGVSCMDPLFKLELGTTTLTYTITDTLGLSSSCTQAVTILDQTKPVINCGEDFKIAMDVGKCFATNTNYFGVMATDNCDTDVQSVQSKIMHTTSLIVGDAMTGTHMNPDSQLQFGNILDDLTECYTGNTKNIAYDLMYKVTDNAGLESTCQVKMTVVDEEAPTVVCPPPIMASLELHSCNYNKNLEDFAAEVTDNCRSDMGTCQASITGETRTYAKSSTMSDFMPSTGIFGPGTHIVKIEASDGEFHNNLGKCTFSITVEEDAEDPFISISETIDAPVEMDKCTLNADKLKLMFQKRSFSDFQNYENREDCASGKICVDAFDNCPGVKFVNNASKVGITWMDDFPADSTQYFKWTAVDTKQMMSEAVVSIKIIDKQTPVMVNCPSDTMIEMDSGKCYSQENVKNFFTPIMNDLFTDNCDKNLQLQYDGKNPMLDMFKMSDNDKNNIIITTTDKFDNAATIPCSFKVLVKEDTEKPKITCPANIMIKTCPGADMAMVTYAAILSSDNCDASTPNMINGIPSGSNFPIGKTMVRFSVTDTSLNSASCEFSVEVQQREHNMWDCNSQQCPNAQTGKTVLFGITTRNLSQTVTKNGLSSTFMAQNGGQIYGVYDFMNSNGMKISNWVPHLITSIHTDAMIDEKKFSPNGLAFDKATKKFFYAAIKMSDKTKWALYSSDLITKEHKWLTNLANKASGVTSGTFYNNNYIFGRQQSAGLSNVHFNGDGTFSQTTVDIFTLAPKFHNFKDLDFNLDYSRLYMGTNSRNTVACNGVLNCDVQQEFGYVEYNKMQNTYGNYTILKNQLCSQGVCSGYNNMTFNSQISFSPSNKLISHVATNDPFTQGSLYEINVNLGTHARAALATPAGQFVYTDVSMYACPAVQEGV